MLVENFGWCLAAMEQHPRRRNARAAKQLVFLKFGRRHRNFGAEGKCEKTRFFNSRGTPPVSHKNGPAYHHGGIGGEGVILAVEGAKFADMGPGSSAPNRPLGAGEPVTGRGFDPTQAGGPIRQLSTGRIRVTDRGIDAVERHIGRFGNDEANQVMVDRLRRIARGEIEPTQYDLNYYSHELREAVRYRRQGFPAGAGDDYDLWNNAHTATLEDYDLRELDANRNRNLFHPDAWPFLPQ